MVRPLAIGLLAVLLSASLAVACGSSDPKEQCDDFVTQWCSRSVSCYGLAGEEAKSGQIACENEAYKGLQCSRVVRTGAGYSQCMSDTSALSCGRLKEAVATGQGGDALPGSCKGVFALE